MTLRAILLAASLLAAPAAQAQDLAGPYLAARIAGFGNDYAAAGDYYARLMRREELPAQVLESAVIIYGALGRFDRAAEAAGRLAEMEAASRFGAAAQLVERLVEGDWDGAEALIEDAGVGGALLDGLLRGWIAAARGDAAAAETAFETLAESGSFAPFAHLHRAYARAARGDLAGAEALLSGEEAGPLQLDARGILARAEVLSLLDRGDEAETILRDALAAGGGPELANRLARLERGEALEWTAVPDARAGMAESYYTLAALLAGESPATFTLINARAATALRPDHVDALILTGELLEDQSQHALANAALGKVPADHPAFFGAEIARAEVLLNSGKEDAAVEVLQGLSRTFPAEPAVWTALGDMLRRLDRHRGAVDAYDRAIELSEPIDERDWFLHYARGIGYERTGRFEQAEADFRRALELRPGHPLVLNYLGYSLVEERIKLDEALGMIEQAVAARPDDGYITDSLGWVLYRLGRYDEAVAPMERAVQLQPLDPLINDHLGDVLWTVGREREASFQWRRALSLEPESEEEVERIRRKLEVGLDRVLEEEGGAGPIEAADE
ncbi:tetratricopeptide repeat protein [Jannaschia sp. W003]|uniref:tetratricopeptide repeat protein n=1 Tax=Jannaschia sp. W003 TaxID=2867012 RepID=UPI0021A31B51|nr:tetratricopeptide repeat protein [Jannaschia sp. W003]UWQ22864.1 tetratricopeptide repeat protein [Jannaschia sp. W003]